MTPIDYQVFLFSGHIYQGLQYSVHLAEGCHYYGRPVALFEHMREEISIVDIGGLLFIWASEDWPQNGLMLARPELSLETVLELMAGCQIDAVSIGNVEDKKVIGQTFRSLSLYLTWLWELFDTGHNRWVDMADRGGRVHNDLLDTEQLIDKLRDGLAPWSSVEMELVPY